MSRRPNVRAGLRHAGFTLVEVLVALVLMAILVTLVWTALDGMLRSRDTGREIVDRASRLATVLSQWEQDLHSIVDAEVVPPVSFDGQTLRLTRRTETGVMLVAWSVRQNSEGGVWQRWAGPAYQRSGELLEAWLRSQQFQGSEPGHVTLATQASQWQVYFHRGGQWTNAQSTGDIAVTPAAPSASSPVVVREVLPDAIRMVITLDGAQLTRDIALGPT